MAYFLTAVGLALLFGGGEALVRGGIGLARLLGFSPLLIGLVIMSAGTSAPELVVALRAVVADHPDIATGNIIGSNIANILLILGIAAMIRPVPTSPKVVFRDGGAMLAASIAFLLFAWDGVITRFDSWLLLLGLLLFMFMSFGLDWRRPSPHSVFATRAASRTNGDLPLSLSLFYVAIGVALLYFGAGLLLDGGLAIGRAWKWPEALTGLTLIAISTSLPELVVTVRSAMKGQAGLAIGNLVGSNIFNILGVLGVVGVVRDVRMNAMLAHQDAIIMTLAAAALLPLLLPQWRLGRKAGMGLVIAYGVYVLFLTARQWLA
ncbi:MAG: calcium/sodium antiporter [Alphaproteobacteria bacterium]